ncbi:hypothetical protein LC593_31175 [Nostoc sp. CHAB 5844]|nr:hypothetical protein [Nostoc sp. CHAB 5844]
MIAFSILAIKITVFAIAYLVSQSHSQAIALRFTIKISSPYVSSMNGSRDIDTQVTLPMELYQAIAQRAQAHGHSVSREIVTLLTPLLMQIPKELEAEFAAWETASDEDWLSTEEMLASLGE